MRICLLANDFQCFCQLISAYAPISIEVKSLEGLTDSIKFFSICYIFRVCSPFVTALSAGAVSLRCF